MKVALKPGSAPVNVEGFGEDVERSCEGALHLMANTFREVSPGELDFIKASKPELYSRLLVHEDAAAPKRKTAQTPAAQAGGDAAASGAKTSGDAQPAEAAPKKKQPQG